MHRLWPDGASPSGKAADFGSAMRRFESSRPSQLRPAERRNSVTAADEQHPHPIDLGGTPAVRRRVTVTSAPDAVSLPDHRSQPGCDLRSSFSTVCLICTQDTDCPGSQAGRPKAQKRRLSAGFGALAPGGIEPGSEWRQGGRPRGGSPQLAALPSSGNETSSWNSVARGDQRSSEQDAGGDDDVGWQPNRNMSSPASPE